MFSLKALLPLALLLVSINPAAAKVHKAKIYKHKLSDEMKEVTFDQHLAHLGQKYLTQFEKANPEVVFSREHPFFTEGGHDVPLTNYLNAQYYTDTVSYTHLDVYKRQLFICKRRKFRP